MKQAISIERWNEAQAAERSLHNLDINTGYAHYKDTYINYFRLLKLGFDLGGLSIAEIGPADVPALAYCRNISRKSKIIEPMPSDILLKLSPGIDIVPHPLECITEDIKTDEVWLFNVMQHIIDPDAFVSKCKEMAKRIRFFEPINYPTSIHHPHEYTMDDFKEWFGDCATLYKGGSIRGFHESDCAYGVYIK